MRPGRGKQKGGNHEREIGQKLSLWLSNGARTDLLCRTVGSGAQFTAVNKGNPGDLMAQDPLAWRLCDKFAIECKHWRDLDILNFLFGNGELYKAMKKVEGEGRAKGKSWMLVARQNYRPDLLFMPVTSLVPTFLNSLDGLKRHILFAENPVYMLRLDEFLQAAVAEEFLK